LFFSFGDSLIVGKLVGLFGVKIKWLGIKRFYAPVSKRKLKFKSHFLWHMFLYSNWVKFWGRGAKIEWTKKPAIHAGVWENERGIKGFFSLKP